MKTMANRNKFEALAKMGYLARGRFMLLLAAWQYWLHWAKVEKQQTIRAQSRKLCNSLLAMHC